MTPQTCLLGLCINVCLLYSYTAREVQSSLLLCCDTPSHISATPLALTYFFFFFFTDITLLYFTKGRQKPHTQLQITEIMMLTVHLHHSQVHTYKTLTISISLHRLYNYCTDFKNQPTSILILLGCSYLTVFYVITPLIRRVLWSFLHSLFHTVHVKWFLVLILSTECVVLL
jgi:hypothetical protein